MKTVIVGWLVLLGTFDSAWASEGCFFNGTPYAAIDRIPGGLPDPRPVVDFYFDDEFTNSTTLNGIPVAVAEDIIKQILVGFQSESGASISFRFAGYDPVMPVNYAGHPILIFSAVDTTAECNGGFMCADIVNTVDMSYGKIWLVRNNSSPNVFRTALIHEVMHTLHFDHQNDPSCAAQWRDDWSVVRASANSETLTMADKRNLRTTYGLSEQTARRRQSQPFATYGWSAPSSLVNELLLAAPKASNGWGRNHGIAYPIAWGNSALTYVRLYEDPNWLAPEVITALSSYHAPDLAWGSAWGANRWAVLIAANDFRESQGPDLVVAERLEGETTWNQSQILDLNLPSPYVAITFDPVSDFWVVAYLVDHPANWSRRLVVRAISRGALVWQQAITFSPSWTVFRGVDIACSERPNSAAGANCFAVGVATNDPSNNSPGPGSVTLFWFNIVNGAPQEAGAPIGAQLRADVPPQVAANPIAGANPQFLMNYTRGDQVDEWRNAYFRTLNDNTTVWSGVQYTYTAAPDDHQYLPFSIGTHVFGGTGYNDLLYSLDY